MVVHLSGARGMHESRISVHVILDDVVVAEACGAEANDGEIAERG